jgi:hypothetical protein
MKGCTGKISIPPERALMELSKDTSLGLFFKATATTVRMMSAADTGASSIGPTAVDTGAAGGVDGTASSVDCGVAVCGLDVFIFLAGVATRSLWKHTSGLLRLRDKKFRVKELAVSKGR